MNQHVKPTLEPALGEVGSMINDAVVMRAVDMNAPHLNETMWVLIGAGAKAPKWVPKEYDRRQVYNLLTTHEESRKKDGGGMVYGRMAEAGPRDKSKITEMWAFAVDVDNRITTARLDELLLAQPYECITYSTYTHLKGETTVSRDKVLAWAAKQTALEGRPDTEVNLWTPSRRSPELGS